MKTNKTHLLLLSFIAIMVIFAWINPIYPQYQLLQHAGTFILCIPIIIDLRFKKLSQFALICLFAFSTFHILGARYIYSYVPYQEWLTHLTGITDGFWVTERNHFDRFVHFSFGLLLFPLCHDYLKKMSNGRLLSSLVFAFLCIQFLSMFYELFEWSLTFVIGKGSEDYNGQQGDVWDAHKDMGLALIGSLITFLFYLIFKSKKS